MKLVSISVSRGQQFKLVLFGALAIGVLATMTGRGTLAFFTTQVTSNANVFTAGTLHLNISDTTAGGGDTTTSVNSSISFANMKPGDTVYAPIELTNSGTLDELVGIKYTTTTSGTQDLAPALKLAILGTGDGVAATQGTGVKATTASGTDPNACNAASFAAPTTIWPEVIRTTAAMVATTGQTITGVASGGAGIPLKAISGATPGNDILCMQVTMVEPGADNQYNNLTNGATNTTVVFTFDGRPAAVPTITNS